MEEKIIVGKQVLETLTIGMYADNEIIFREYIQNSADAIDKAVSLGVLESRDDGKIDVVINDEKRNISIKDNGIGIKKENVDHYLGDIGKSQKSYTENRGFRGIGRLAGLAYCKQLKFITSFKGESEKTIMVWDCQKLKEFLQPNAYQEMSVVEVINEITTSHIETEDVDTHYFEVHLIDIDEEASNLLNIDDIQSYLEQVAPVPFDSRQFSELSKIKEKLIELGKEHEEFDIYLNGEQIYKPYKRNFQTREKKNDFIKSIEFFYEFKENGELYFFGWYGMTDFYGLIQDDKISGLRARKGNILIGNNRTLDSFFGNNTNQRFNRWFVGELYVFDENLIPNGQRDDFEKNLDYFKFKKLVEKTTLGKLKKIPNEYSDNRGLIKEIGVLTNETKEIEKELKSNIPITGTRKIQLEEKLDSNFKRVEKLKVKLPELPKGGDNIHSATKELKENIDKIEVTNKSLQTKIEEHKKDNSKDSIFTKLRSKYSREGYHIIDAIFNTIDTMLEENLARQLKEHIVEKLLQNSKNHH